MATQPAGLHLPEDAYRKELYYGEAVQFSRTVVHSPNFAQLPRSAFERAGIRRLTVEKAEFLLRF